MYEQYIRMKSVQNNLKSCQNWNETNTKLLLGVDNHLNKNNKELAEKTNSLHNLHSYKQTFAIISKGIQTSMNKEEKDL